LASNWNLLYRKVEFMAADAKPFYLRVSTAKRATLTASPDKSISQRALLFGLLAQGETNITGILDGEDVRATRRAVEALGAMIIDHGKGALTVTGRGKDRLLTPGHPLDFGNSGTGCRLTMGVVAGQGVAAMFTGDASLSRRPMARITDPLRAMGARISGTADRLPLRIDGASELKAICYKTPMASAQVKSAILLAGLGAEGITQVIEPHQTRPHTEEMLAAFGVEVEAGPVDGGHRVAMRGGQILRATDIDVPGDPSSAAFMIAASLLTPGGELVVRNIIAHPTRTGFLRALTRMTDGVTIQNTGDGCIDVHIRHAPLAGFSPEAALVSDMIDEFPIFAVLAATTPQGAIIRHASELRVKESDRIAATVAMLHAAGVAAQELPDGLIIPGTEEKLLPGGGTVKTHHDHRIAMSGALLGLVCAKPLIVDDLTMIATSYPTFFSDLSQLGIQKVEDNAA
jgi:3-phosphoshikimate 1-carboxyvinyltransferase